ncbi:MAG: hypothetical protein HY721_05405 [Planctomycetes bacterium]|nr:hypothetical protein [Planctomycetota bacterium]
MTAFYLASLLAGLALVVVGAWVRGEPAGGARGASDDELGLPGARVGRSDEYLREGGIGGAEGEGLAPGFHAAADGGVGGAEGCAEPEGRAPGRLRALELPAVAIVLGASGLATTWLAPGLGRAGTLAVSLALSGLAGAAAAAARLLGARRP